VGSVLPFAGTADAGLTSGLRVEEIDSRQRGSGGGSSCGGRRCHLVVEVRIGRIGFAEAVAVRLNRRQGRTGTRARNQPETGQSIRASSLADCSHSGRAEGAGALKLTNGTDAGQTIKSGSGVVPTNT
jgi:hypothetical protein